MKVRYVVIMFVWFVAAVISLFALIFWLGLYSYDIATPEYYSDDDNYSYFRCDLRSYTVTDNAIYIDFEHNQQDFYNNFVISGKNYDIATDNNIFACLKEGETFYVSAASGYFGDGWNYPVVSLEHDAVTIIPYEQGKQNVVDMQRDKEEFAIGYITVVGSVLGAVMAAGGATVIVILVKSVKKRNEDMQSAT